MVIIVAICCFPMLVSPLQSKKQTRDLMINQNYFEIFKILVNTQFQLSYSRKLNPFKPSRKKPKSSHINSSLLTFKICSMMRIYCNNLPIKVVMIHQCLPSRWSLQSAIIRNSRTIQLKGFKFNFRHLSLCKNKKDLKLIQMIYQIITAMIRFSIEYKESRLIRIFACL